MHTPALFSPWRPGVLPSVAVFLGLTVAALAQQTPAVPAEATVDVLQLSPFEVNTSRDQGFVATSSLAGGRLDTPLKDTPVSYSVLTKEFIDAFNITDLTQATQWSVNTTYNPGNNTDQGFGFSPAINITMRGAAPGESNYPMRDFFPYNSNADSYALDRFDFARGPNAILFGAGQFGGTISAVTKRALVTKQIDQVQIQVGSWNKLRVTVDENRPLNDKAAVRVDAMGDTSGTWRTNEWRHSKALFLAGTYNLTKNTTIRANGEYAETQQKIFPTAFLDQVSAWDGKTTFSGPLLPANAPNSTAQAVAGVNYGTSGTNVAQVPLWVYDPTAFGTSNVLNFANVLRTKGAAGNATAAATNFLGGVPIASASVTYNGQPMLDGYDVPSGRYQGDLLDPNFHVPSRGQTNLWTHGKPTQSQTAKDFSLTVNHRVGDSLFFEVAVDTNKVKIDGNNAVNRGANTMYIDITQSLPNGASNPNFLQPYTEFWDYQNIRWYELRAIRAQMAYVKETRFGKLQLAALAGANYQRQEKRSYLYLLPLQSIGPDARYWDAGQNNTALWNRLYLNQGGRNFYNTDLSSVTLQNQDGTTQTVTPVHVLDASRKDNSASNITQFKHVMGAGNFSLFHDRLIFIGAYRRDLTDLRTRNTLNPGDYPTGWDGHQIIFKPDAPADWSTLTYLPKSATGQVPGPALPADTRPRLSVAGTAAVAGSSILPQPQYAGDRFRDDYNPPALTVGVNTYSFGTVFNVTKWLGVYGNDATTFNPNVLVQRLNGSLLKPTSAHGAEYGVRLSPWGDKAYLSLGVFNSYQVNSPIAPPGALVTNYNTIYSTPVVGDFSPDGANIRNQGLLPSVVRDTLTQQSHGIELEFTANLTRSWRLLFNAAYTRAWQTDSFPDSRAYIAAKDAVSRQILADSGILINSANVASIDPALNDPSKINTGAATKAVNAWNNTQQSIIPNLAVDRQKLVGSTEQTLNLGTDYTFHTGRLDGFSFGVGGHYRGRNVVGYRGADTIVNPASPTAAVDDPTVNQYTTVFSKPTFTADARAGYVFKLKEHRKLTLSLNVQNLLNNRTPIYFLDVPGGQASNVVLRPRGGDVSSPAVETVPAGFYYRAPINWTLTARVDL